jgi:hypothetical protein
VLQPSSTVSTALESLSSSLTLTMKAIFPALWLLMFGGFTIALFLGFLSGINPSQWVLKLIFPLVFVMAFACFWWLCFPLKFVRVDGAFLYVSNFLVEHRIPLVDVADVTEITWINIHPVTLHLAVNTPFGRRIVFMPKQWSGIRSLLPFSSHPVVAALKQRIAAARG